MKFLMILGLFIAVLLPAPMTVVAAVPADHPCATGTAPEGWLRPGGFCDKLKSTASISGQGSCSLQFEYVGTVCVLIPE